MQVECQVGVRRAQALAAFCNAENAMLRSKRKRFAELGRVASGVFTNRQVNAGRCWVNVPVDEQDRTRCLSWNCLETNLGQMSSAQSVGLTLLVAAC
jgi:hypothetical protein